MKDQACDLCDPEAPTTAFAMVSILGTGDVKLVCPADFVAMGDAMREQIAAAVADAQAEHEATVPGPVPDPVTGDDTDEDQALDGEHTDGSGREGAFSSAPVPAGPHPDATPLSPEAVPADPAEVGSG